MQSKNENSINGQLITAVVRSKIEGKDRKRVYIVDLKIKAFEESNGMFTLNNLLDQYVEVKINKKQLQFGDKL